MAYPQSYDNIEVLDLSECAMYSHMVTDGIIETPGNMAIGGTYMAFARYGSGTPKMTIVDPVANTVLIADVLGEYSTVTTLWKFEAAIPAAWTEKAIIVVVHSDDSELVFTRHTAAISQNNAYATSADIEAMGQMVKDEVCGCVSTGTTNMNTTLTNVESGIKQILRDVTDEINENQTIMEKTGFRIII